MRRGQYIGNVSASGVATPAEATTYFNRMTTAPSAAFRTAVINAITRWKALGVYSSIIQLVLFCAETSQASLLDLGPGQRDATIGAGTPTFTASKGYSGLSATNSVSFNVSAATLADDAFTTIFGGLVNDTIANATAIDPVAGGSSLSQVFGCFNLGGGQQNGGGSQGKNIATANSVGALGSADPVVFGSKGGITLSATGFTTVQISTFTRIGNYRTALIAAPHNITRLSVSGYLGSAVTADNARKFFIVLGQLLDDIGALN